MIQRYLDWRTARARPPVVLSVRAARYGAVATLIGLGMILAPMYAGYSQAIGDAPELVARADDLIAEGRADGSIETAMDGLGWGALRRTGYVMGLEARLTEGQLRALGCGPEGCA